MKMKRIMCSLWGISMMLLVTFLASCQATKSISQIRYAQAWQRVLNSQAWHDDLPKEESQVSEQEAFYVSGEDVILSNDLGLYERKRTLKPNFEIQYDVLVRRAYLRIIAQASKADDRLEKEYILRNAMALKKGKKRSKEFDKRLDLVNKRYHAHREMLEGLKSWNISSEYGIDDLEFFKAEHRAAVQEMIQKGKRESSVINYLIYKLADLYHFER